MNLHYAESRVLKKELLTKEAIIRLYERETGISGNNIELMEESFRLKSDVQKDCLSAAEQLPIFKDRARRRGVTIAIGIPVAALVGYGTGVLLSPR